MIKKKKSLVLFSLLIMFCLLVTACDGAGGSSGDETGWSEDPEPTLDGGGGVGNGEVPEEPEEPEEDEEGSEDMDLVPLVAPCVPRQGDATGFQLNYQDITWFGPPQVKIGPALVTASVKYTYDEETKRGVLQMLSTGLVEMPIEVTFPECRGDVYNTNVKFQARAEGTCKDNQISLTVYEIWNSVSVDIPCEANSDVCGEDPCPYPLLLPFAYAGEQGITVKYDLDPTTGSIIQEKMDLPFLGVGASGSKSYTLLWR